MASIVKPVQASAPGKLVLGGEYAVLLGAPAVVLALDCRAQATVAPQSRAGIRLQAPEIGVPELHGSWEVDHLAWQTRDPALLQLLRLVTLVLEQELPVTARDGGWSIRLDTHAFFSGTPGCKLGLGSSAAVLVALVAALRAVRGAAQPSLGELIRLHRLLQSGHGSGIGLAAALEGGALHYEAPAHVLAQARPLRWPPGLHFRVLWSGHPSSTARALMQLADWRVQAGDAATRLLSDLQAGAVALAAAMAAGHAAELLAHVAEYAADLDRLGQASGIDIFSAEHRQLAALAQHHGLIYKPCGAGGGDVGIALGERASALDALARAARAQGYTPLDLAIDERGLQVRTMANP